MKNTMFYSNSTNGFYSTQVHGKNIPNEAVEISQEAYLFLLEGQSKGQQIISDQNGYPTLITTVKSKEEILLESKTEAKLYLKSTDWYVTRKIETGKEIPEEILNKRQEAREVLSPNTKAE